MNLTDDTPFRLYREANTHLSPKRITWTNVAGTIDEVRRAATKLGEDDGTKHALLLKQRIEAAIFRFGEGERVFSLALVFSSCSFH